MYKDSGADSHDLQITDKIENLFENQEMAKRSMF